MMRWLVWVWYGFGLGLVSGKVEPPNRIHKTRPNQKYGGARKSGLKETRNSGCPCPSDRVLLPLMHPTTDADRQRRGRCA